MGIKYGTSDVDEDAIQCSTCAFEESDCTHKNEDGICRFWKPKGKVK